MIKAKNARPVEATTGQASGKAASNFREDCSMKPATCQFMISDFLSHGERNAVPLRQLRQMTGLDERIIRRKIQTERLSGTPILSNNLTGYYLPADDAERSRCVRSMHRRALEIARTARAIAAATLTAEKEG